MAKNAIILLNLGGPDSLDAVQPFLFNLFCDPDIFKIPFGQKFLAGLISKRRSPRIVEQYKQIGGKSPINEWTEIQRKKLTQTLSDRGADADVYTAMRYWKPLTAETAEIIRQKNYQNVILLPLYPHFSVSTTGSSFNEWDRVYKGDQTRVKKITTYFNHPGYVAALNAKIDEGLLKFPEHIRQSVLLLFSAHGTPVSMVKKGDPYSKEIKETIDAVMALRNKSHDYALSFQSKVGPVGWVRPATDEKIEELSKAGKKHLLVIPVSFVSDHIETLFELDIEYRHVAHEAGIENFIVMPGLNDSQVFINALADIVTESSYLL